MFRKITTLITTMVVMFALMPALAASAANANATLTSATVLKPGSNPFTISVNSTDNALLNVTSVINGVSVILPPNVTADCSNVTAMPGSFTCNPLPGRGARGYYFSGGMIAAGGTGAFSFNGVVSQPNNADLNASAFRVDVTQDNGATFTRAGSDAALDFDVRALELRNYKYGTRPAANTTVGLADNTARITGGTVPLTGTAPVNAQFDLEYYSVNAPAVAPSLAVGGDSGNTLRITPSTFAFSNRVGTAAFAINAVTPPTTNNGVVNTVLTAQDNDPNSVAAEPTLNLTVEHTPELTPQPLAFSNRVIGIAPATYNFILPANKVYTPAVNPLTSTLRLFRDGQSSLGGHTPLYVIPLSSTGATAIPRGNSNNLGFTYSSNIDLAAKLGAALPTQTFFLDAEVSYSGTDDNGAPYAQLGIKLDNLIEIDLDAPNIDINRLVSNAPLTSRVRNTNNVTIAGTIDPREGTGPNDIDFATLVVTLSSDDGSFAVSSLPSTPANPKGTISVTRNGNNFTATYNGAKGLPDGGRLTASATIRDTSGNPSTLTVSAPNPSLTIDNIEPYLNNGDNRAATRDANGVVTGREGSGIGSYRDTDANGASIRPQVRVNFVDGNNLGDIVSGGCLPAQWSITGATVVDVQYWNGQSCVTTSGGPATAPAAGSGLDVNDRILILNQEIDTDTANPVQVRYLRNGPLGTGLSQPVLDRTGNSALDDAANIVNGNLPNPLTLVRGDRTNRDTNAVEQATERPRAADDATTVYYTNNFLDVTATGGQTVDDVQIASFDPARPAGNDPYAANDPRYTLTNFRGGSARLDFTGNPLPINVNRNCGTAGRCVNANQPFAVRLVREVRYPSGQLVTLYGPWSEFYTTFDTVRPLLDTATATGDDVRVAFTEAVDGTGTNYAIDWSALEVNANAQSNAQDDKYFFLRPESVEVDGDGARILRNVGRSSRAFGGAAYEFTGFGSSPVKYRDLAGNFITDIRTNGNFVIATPA